MQISRPIVVDPTKILSRRELAAISRVFGVWTKSV
jgi:hypothetical protein